MTFVQLTLRMDSDIHDQIKKIADKDDRSMNHQICLLLAQALKERGRKKRAVKEDRT